MLRDHFDRQQPGPVRSALDGDVSALLAWAAAGADTRSPNAQGVTPLMAAAQRGRRFCVEALLPISDPALADHCGQTALMWAANAGCARCVELLIPEGSPRAVAPWVGSALMEALRGGAWVCAELLLPHSDPLARDRAGRGALSIVAAHGEAEWAARLAALDDPRALDISSLRRSLESKRDKGEACLAVLAAWSERWALAEEAAGGERRVRSGRL